MVSIGRVIVCNYEGHGGNYAWCVLSYWHRPFFEGLRNTMEKLIDISGFWIENRIWDLLNMK
jgi:hypothetical protein